VKQLKLSRPATIALILGGDLLLLVLGWVLLVSPQRTNAASMARATEATQAQIVEAQQALHATPPKAPTQPEIKTAGLYELAKAMPSTTDMPDVLLELDQVARAAGVEVGSITPGPATVVVGAPYSMVQIQLTFSGNFYSLTDLLYRLNNLVAVQDGTLDASGRLFAVNSVALSPNGVGNGLNATVTVNAYIYGTPSGASSATAAPAATPTTTSTGTSTGTTSTPTTTGSASTDVAPRP
jgi:Tfp pilus assembly protein PilO